MSGIRRCEQSSWLVVLISGPVDAIVTGQFSSGLRVLLKL